MLNRYASLLLLLLLAATGLSGCSMLGGGSGDWDGRDPFTAAALKAPLTAEFKQRFGLGLTLLEQGPDDEALSHWQSMTADYPQYAGVWVNYGLAQSAMGAWEIAELAYREALTINSEYCDAYSLKGLAQREQGLFMEAQSSYEAAIKCNPKQGDYYYNLGILFDLYRNELTSALTAYRMARRLMPDEEQLNVWVIDLARRTDQPEEDPQRIDDWYYQVTGTQPPLPEPEAEPQLQEETDGEAETEAESTEAGAESAEQPEDNEQQAFQYNERINPFLPDDSAETDTEETEG